MTLNQTTGKNIAKNGVWALGANIVSALTGILYTAVLSRMLEPSALGTYLLLLSFVMFLVIPSNLGLPVTAVRTIAKEIGAGKLSYALSFVFKCFLFTLIASFIVFIFLVFGPADSILLNVFKIETELQLLVLISIWVFLLAIHALITECLRGLNDIKHASLYGTMMKNSMIFIILTVLSITAIKVDISIAVAAICAALIISIILSANALTRNFNSLLGTIETTNDKPTDCNVFQNSEIVRLTTPFFLNALLLFATLRIGIWIVGYYLPKEDVAIYGACLQLVILVVIPLTIINAILPPLVSNLFFNNNDNDKLELILRTSTTIAGIPSILALLCFAFFGAEVLSLIFGSFYAQGATILCIFAIAQCTNMLVGPTGTVLKMTNHQALLLRVNIVIGILTIIFSAVAAKMVGITAVALVTAVSIIINNLYTLYLVRTRVGVNCSIYARPSDFRNLVRNANQLKRSF